ncbi:Manganese/iron superoxide dismutase [Suillus paluster]|uniref:Manganese/iron superoxide dismutase n=1 Tax=Suillus paluster TaxID=48578 RepID=UPI001B868F82|nr:Manganese/iron superoxide dismutase [Suillus paluster]KAG1739816.1 Manganese/iron superoxide dismutase [Suillus paluster]
MSSVGLRLASSSALSAWKSTKCPRQLWGARRHLHSRIELPYKVDEGLGNFMSPRTLKMVSEEYQQGLLDRLNEMFPDAADQRKSVTQLVIDTASSGKDALGFSYASHALNNSFFLNCLQTPTEKHYEDFIHNTSIAPVIRSQFGSFSHFINNFSSAARGMSGSGYIWLITDTVGQPCHSAHICSRHASQNPAGQYEVLHEGRFRDGPQPTHLNTGVLHHCIPSAPVRTLHSSLRSRQDGARSFYDSEPIEQASGPSTRSLRYLGERIYPLFCVSIHEHCWLLDHGVWGKEKYMKELWSVLNWNKVSERYSTFKSANAGPQPLRM